jgi:PAS domain S-box-containing protein
LKVHKLLERQLRKFFGAVDAVPEEFVQLLDMVDQGYRQADLDRTLLERSMDLTSAELMEANAELSRERTALELRVRERTAALREANEALQREMAEREQANLAIRKSEARYRALFEESRDAICVTTRDGRLLDLNQAAVDGLGFGSREAALGESVLQLYADPSQREDLLDELERKGFVDGKELDLQTLDGRRVVMLASCVPVRSEADEETATRTTLRDVTQRRALQRELAQSQKLEAVGRLAGGVAHDFNNLLTAIVGCSSLLAEIVDADSESAALVEEISAAAHRGADLTQRLLAFGRRQVYVGRRLDLNEVVVNVRSLLARLLGEDVEITSRLDARDAAIVGDLSQIEQVIVNLGINARDAMPDGGRLHFSTCNLVVGARDASRYPALSPGRYVSLTVRDTGVGIDEKIQPLIFEPFFTTKSSGTGLGLATVYAIVQQSGGHVRLESAVGQGSTFELLWPATEAVPEAERATVEMRKSGMAGSGEVVLVVDDDGAVLALAQRVLERHGFRALAAGSGGEAVRMFEDERGEVDLLVSDVVMPGMQGPELALALRGSQPGLPVLLMSGYTESLEGLRRAAVDPTTDFLPKPFGPGDLMEKVRTLLRPN